MILEPALDAELIPPDTQHLAIHQAVGANRYSIDGDSTLSKQVDNPHAYWRSQQTTVEPGDARIGETELATGG